MFGISFYEILVILVIALMLFKPKEFGNILFNLGKFIKKVKQFIFNIQSEVEDFQVLGNPKDYIIKEKNKQN